MKIQNNKLLNSLKVHVALGPLGVTVFILCSYGLAPSLAIDQ